MKKILLSVITCLGLLQGALAQCPTCHDGRHDPDPNFVANTKIKPHDGSGTLGQSYIQQNVCGLNYAAATAFTATRYSPPGTGFPTTLTIAGMPTTCLTILKAFLYYGVSYTEGTAPATTATVTNPSAASGTYAAVLTGTAPSVCWGESGTAGYRADVTPIITANGNYTVDLGGFANENYEVDGITLIIIYTSPQTWTGSIVLYDGCMSNSTGATMSYTGTGFNVCSATGTANAFGCMGDMQNNVLPSNTDTYNGSTATFPNNFWNFNVVPTTLTAAQSTCVFDSYTNNLGSDCWLWSLAGLYWQNTGCVTCSAGSITLTTTQVNPTCSATGSATVTATGGSAPYTYLWSDGQTNSTATGLSGGSYTVTVKDVACNTATATVTLTVASSLTITPSTTPALCNGGNTGTASVTVTGGTPGYTYSWAPSGGNASTASGLTAGSYTCTVTDASGCTGTQTIVVGQPTAITTTSSSTPDNCAANNGTATITPTGGTPGYTYSWAPSAQTSATATGLSAGTYVVTVKDANGCTVTANVTVAASGAVITATTTPTNVLCNGGTGSATVTAPAGGTAPYTYVWSNAQTGTNATGLSIGTYTVTITDKNGCSGTETVTITQPAPLVITTSSTTATCNQSNGSASVTSTTGGTGPYTYSWAPVGGAGAIANGLSASSYTVTVKDANNCTITATVIVPNANGPHDSISAFTNVTCFGGNNGSATVGVIGGTGPYTYSWTTAPVQTNATATNLSAGTYNVTATDATGCTTSVGVTITEPTQLRDSIISSVNLKCYNVSTGSATAGVKGGTGPYTYSWNSAPVQTTITATNLSAGTYIITITDANLCTTNATVTITQPTAVQLTAAGFPTSCFGSCDGQVAVIPSGGTTPYTYLWEPGGNTNGSQPGVCAGTDSIYVTDANGCKHDSAVTVTQPTAITLTKASTTAFCNQADGSASVTAAGGTPGYTYLWSTGAVTTNITNVKPGTYCVTVTDANKCTDSICVVVPNTTGETASITATTNVTCNGGADGTATAGGAGGTAPYTYSWSTIPPQLTQTATGLSAGTYTVTLTDATGCQATAVATITEPALVVTTASGPQTICIGQNATMSVSATGGTAPYTFTWNPPGATGANATMTPVVTTTYTITTVDANGCPGAQVTITITVNPPLNVVAGPTRAMCPGGNATLTSVATGGDGTYTYVWIPGGMNGASVNVSPAVTTTYTVTVNDGCGTPAATTTETVIVDPLPVVSFTADTTNGCYPLCINFKDMTTIASGGVNKWQWTFGNGGTSSHADTTFCYMTPGLYTVGLTVTSDSGCSSNQAVPNMITVYDHPHANFIASPQPATIIDPTVTFTDQSTDAYGIVSWQWLFGDPLDGFSKLQNPSYTYADTGTYCPRLTVTNKYGCVDSITQCIVIEPFFTLYIPNAFSPNGDGKNDIFAPKGNYICGFQMYIFDRWGMQLFYTEDMLKGWNGTVNGSLNIAQQDTYVYIINAVDCISNKKHTYIGKVSIIQ